MFTKLTLDHPRNHLAEKTRYGHGGVGAGDQERNDTQFAFRASRHAQPFLYGPNVRLHLPELYCISWLDIFPESLNLF
jgi:hypothetical protein